MPRSGPRPGLYYGWVLVAVAFLAVAVSFGPVIVFTFGVFLKPLSSEFGWSRGEISLAFSLAAITVSLCSPMIGRWTDRSGARQVIVICASFYAAAFASLSWLGGSLWQLYATYIAIGLVGNGATQLPYSRVITEWFDQRRGLALSLMMTGVGAGVVVMPALAQWLIDRQGWRGAYLMLGLLMLLLAVPLPAALLRHSPDQSSSSHTVSRNGAPAQAADPLATAPVSKTAAPATGSGTASLPGSNAAAGLSVGQALRRTAFWQLLACFFLFSLAMNGCVAHLAPLFTDRGLPAQQAALAASVLGIATMIGRVLTGWLLDRYFGPWIAAIFFGKSALGMLLLLTVSGPSVAWPAALLLGFSMGAEADVMPYLVGRYFGLRSFTELYGYAFSAYAVAGAIGPSLMGLSFDRSGNYSEVLVLFVCSVVASSLLLLRLPRYQNVSSEQAVVWSDYAAETRT